MFVITQGLLSVESIVQGYLGMSAPAPPAPPTVAGAAWLFLQARLEEEERCRKRRRDEEDILAILM